MENVNNLNGVPNFGHGHPEVLANEETHEQVNEEAEGKEDVAGNGGEAKEIDDFERSE